MNACFDWRDQLLDHALGFPASAELESHLVSCGACGKALADWRARAEHLDAGVRQLLASEPSPYFGSRLLAKIRSAPAGAGWAGHWRVALLALVFITAIVLLIHGVRGTRVARERARAFSSTAGGLSQWSSPTDTLLRSPADPLFRTVPRLGELFFEMRPTGGESKREKGGENAN